MGLLRSFWSSRGIQGVHWCYLNIFFSKRGYCIDRQGLDGGKDLIYCKKLLVLRGCCIIIIYLVSCAPLHRLNPLKKTPTPTHIVYPYYLTLLSLPIIQTKLFYYVKNSRDPSNLNKKIIRQTSCFYITPPPPRLPSQIFKCLKLALFLL